MGGLSFKVTPVQMEYLGMQIFDNQIELYYMTQREISKKFQSCIISPNAGICMFISLTYFDDVFLINYTNCVCTQ